MTAWTIAGNGPSLRDATQADVVGPLSVVNRAIYHDGLTPDYWVCVDKPTTITSTDEGRPWIPRKQPVLVTGTTNGLTWERLWPELCAEQGRTVIAYDDTASMWRALPWASVAKWKHWSILTALYHAWHHGARQIRFLGVDMIGEDYGFGRQRVKSAKRWGEERRDLSLAMTELAKHGGVTFDGMPPYAERVLHCARACDKRKQIPMPITLAYDLGQMTCECGADLVTGAASMTGAASTVGARRSKKRRK